MNPYTLTKAQLYERIARLEEENVRLEKENARLEKENARLIAERDAVKIYEETTYVVRHSDLDKPINEIQTIGKHLELPGWTACRVAMLDEHGDCIRVYDTRKAAYQALGISPGAFIKHFNRFGEYPIKFEGQDCTLVAYNTAGHTSNIFNFSSYDEEAINKIIDEMF